MKLQQLMDDARARLYEAVRDEILSSPSKPYAAIAYEYGITQVTVWKDCQDVRHLPPTRPQNEEPPTDGQGSKRMSFLSIATPFIQLGIPVFPLSPKTKIPPSGLHFLEEATIDPKKVASWNEENPDYNVALLANDEFCFLEFDVAKGMSTAAAEMGQKSPIDPHAGVGQGIRPLHLQAH
jgi:hypothetical protein